MKLLYLLFCTFVALLSAQQCNIIVGDYRTETQDSWGASSNGNNAASYRDAKFSMAFPFGLSIGVLDARQVTFTSAAAINALLPSIGPAYALPATNNNDTVYDVTTNLGGLAGQTVAATLNVGFDLADANFSASPDKLEDLVFVAGPCGGVSIKNLIIEANALLAGFQSPLQPDDVVSCLNSFNSNFNNGTVNNNVLYKPSATSAPDDWELALPPPGTVFLSDEGGNKYGLDNYLISQLTISTNLSFEQIFNLSVSDGWYDAYCADGSVAIWTSTAFGALLYSSYDPTLSTQCPTCTDDEDWPRINYIINHIPAGATFREVQEAIWYFADTPYTGLTIGGDANIRQAIIQDAVANGGSFKPVYGQVTPVIAYSLYNRVDLNDTYVQLTFLIVDVPPPRTVACPVPSNAVVVPLNGTLYSANTTVEECRKKGRGRFYEGVGNRRRYPARILFNLCEDGPGPIFRRIFGNLIDVPPCFCGNGVKDRGERCDALHAADRFCCSRNCGYQNQQKACGTGVAPGPCRDVPRCRDGVCVSNLLLPEGTACAGGVCDAAGNCVPGTPPPPPPDDDDCRGGGNPPPPPPPGHGHHSCIPNPHTPTPVPTTTTTPVSSTTTNPPPSTTAPTTSQSGGTEGSGGSGHEGHGGNSQQPRWPWRV